MARENGQRYVDRELLSIRKLLQTTLQNKRNYSTEVSPNVLPKHQEELCDRLIIEP